MAGILWVVATPIGNLGDWSARAIATLQSADLIACEDTRHSGQLLAHAGIDKPLISLNDHNESGRIEGLLARLERGEALALISDAGTPLISDPGYKLVKAARLSGIEVRPIPGACAAISALSVSGIPSDRFYFEGFLPAQSAARLKRLHALASQTATLIFYESTHRIGESLRDLAQALGPDRQAFVGREMTKQFEEYRWATLEVLSAHYQDPASESRGEFVLICEGAADQPNGAKTLDAKALHRALLEELSPSQAAKVTAKITGLKRSEIYAWTRLQG